MVDSIRKYSANVRFTIYPDANHNSWDATYSNDSLYTWLLAHKRYSPSRIQLTQNALKNYTGVFLGSDGDTLIVQAENKMLMIMAAKGGEDRIEAVTLLV